MEVDSNFKKLVRNLDKEFADAVANDSVDDNDEESDDAVIKEVALDSGNESAKKSPDQEKENKKASVAQSGKMKVAQSPKENGPTFKLESVRKLPNWELYVQRTGFVSRLHLALILQLDSLR